MKAWRSGWKHRHLAGNGVSSIAGAIAPSALAALAARGQ